MSVCEVSDDEELLIEEKICDQCDFVSKGEDLLKRHHDDCHTKTIVSTLEENVPTPPAVKPIPLYKCNSCTFATTTTDELKDHKTVEHVIKMSIVKDGPEENIPDQVDNPPAVKTLPLFTCDECTFMTRNETNLKEHKSKKHNNNGEEMLKKP